MSTRRSIKSWVAAAVIVAAIAVAVGVGLTSRDRAPATAAARDAGASATPGRERGQRPAAPTATADPASDPTTGAPAPVEPDDAGAGRTTDTRADGMPSGTLPATPPARYQVDEADRTFVNLRGGASSMRAYGDLAAEATRSLRGRVVDAAGAPVADAIVVAGPQLAIRWAHLSGQDGSAVGADGGFELRVATTEVHAVAIAARGWSAVTMVPAGAADTSVTLRIDDAARIRGSVTRGGEPEQAELSLAIGSPSPSVSWELETDPDGRFEVSPLSPGVYQLRIAASQMLEGGSSASVTRTVELTAGRTTDLDIELPTGTLLIVTVPLPDDADAMVEYVFVRDATVTAASKADLLAQVPADHREVIMFGGSSVFTPMQFHDRPPGDHTVCIEVKLIDPPMLGFVCRPVSIGGTDPAIELTIEVPLAEN